MFSIVQGTARSVRLNVTNSLGYFLIQFTNQFNEDEVLAVFNNTGSTLKPMIFITDTGGYGSPNPLFGEVNLNVIGNWEAKIYSQASASNLNVGLATNLLSTTTVFVQGDGSCAVPERNSAFIKTCQDVKNCIGIDCEGDADKYLNELGNWVTVTSGGGGSSAYELEITGDDNPANDVRIVTHGLNNSKPTVALWYEYEGGKWRQLDITQGITTDIATPNVLTINLLAYEGNTTSNKYSITVR